MKALSGTTTATKDQRLGEDIPENPEDLLPEGSIRSLDEYLAMQQSIGNRTRFEIVYRLAHGGSGTSKSRTAPPRQKLPSEVVAAGRPQEGRE